MLAPSCLRTESFGNNHVVSHMGLVFEMQTDCDARHHSQALPNCPNQTSISCQTERQFSSASSTVYIEIFLIKGTFGFRGLFRPRPVFKFHIISSDGSLLWSVWPTRTIYHSFHILWRYSPSLRKLFFYLVLTKYML